MMHSRVTMGFALARGAAGCLLLLALTAGPLLAAPSGVTALVTAVTVPATPTVTATAAASPPAPATPTVTSTAAVSPPAPTTTPTDATPAPFTTTATATLAASATAAVSPAGPTATPTELTPGPGSTTEATPGTVTTTPTSGGGATGPVSPTGTPTPVIPQTTSPTGTPTRAIGTLPRGSGWRSSTTSPTQTGSPTITTTPTPPQAGVITDVWPASLNNDQPHLVSVHGIGLAHGAGMTVGGLALSNVHLDAAGVLTGTLAQGLCPGRYAVTVALPGGGRAVGGALTVHGVRSIAVDQPIAGSAIALNGRSQLLTMPLPAIQVTDTTCGDAWHLVVTVEVQRDDRSRPSRLAPQAIRIEALKGMAAARAELSGVEDKATGLVTVPHPRDRVSATLIPIIEIRIPASALAGHYVPHLDVAFAQTP